MASGDPAPEWLLDGFTITRTAFNPLAILGTRDSSSDDGYLKPRMAADVGYANTDPGGK